jgi:hypothetical protein
MQGPSKTNCRNLRQGVLSSGGAVPRSLGRIRSVRPPPLFRRGFCVGPKRYAEPVALSSTAHVDFPISGLAAFLVRSSRAVSTYLRSVLDARGNLVAMDRRCKARPKRTAAICDNGVLHPSDIPRAAREPRAHSGRRGSALDQKDTPSRWRFRPPPTLTFRSQALRPSSYGLRERFRPTCAPCSTQEAT